MDQLQNDQGANEVDEKMCAAEVKTASSRCGRNEGEERDGVNNDTSPEQGRRWSRQGGPRPRPPGDVDEQEEGMTAIEHGAAHGRSLGIGETRQRRATEERQS